MDGKWSSSKKEWLPLAEKEKQGNDAGLMELKNSVERWREIKLIIQKA